MRWPLIRLLPSETHFRFVRYAPYAAVLAVVSMAASWLLARRFGAATVFRPVP